MKTDELGIPRFSNKDLIDMIYTGHVDKCHVVLCDESDDVDLFNKARTFQLYYIGICCTYVYYRYIFSVFAMQI